MGSSNPKQAGVFRVLHTADWHLGKLLGEHSRDEEHRLFLTFLLEAIREYSVDCLIVAGDVFDSGNPPQSALALYYNFLSSLFRQGHCQVVIVAGNHDSPAQLEAPKRILSALGAHVIGGFPASCQDLLIPFPNSQAPRLLVAAVPFLRDRDLRTGHSGQGAVEIQRELVEGIRNRYREAAETATAGTPGGTPILATGHLTVAGSATSDSERDIHIGGLGIVGADCFSESFAYVALGHLHRPQAAGGRDNIRYSGSPIPLSFSEAGDRKEVRLLDFSEARPLEQSPLFIPDSRKLAQIRSTRSSLELDLKAFQPHPSPLPAWVEVVVEDPVQGENLYDVVRGLVKGREFEVIRVVGKSSNASAGLRAEDKQLQAGIEELLGNPAGVFSKRLDEEAGLNDEEKSDLKTVFAELLTVRDERALERLPTANSDQPKTRGAQ